MPVFLEWYGNPVIVSLLFPYHTPIIFKRYGILSKACQHFPYQMPEFFSWYGNHVKASMLFPYHTLVFFNWYGIHGKACHRFPYHTPIFFNRYGIHVKTGQQLYISLSPKTTTTFSDYFESNFTSKQIVPNCMEHCEIGLNKIGFNLTNLGFKEFVPLES